MEYITTFEFDYLNQEHFERLQRMREKLGNTMELQHQIERGQITLALKNYWQMSNRERDILRYGRGVY